MDNAPTRPSRPGLDDFTHSLDTPLDLLVVRHADLVEAVRRHVVADEPVPSGTVPVAAFNSAI
ncbi:hypothetical protein AB0B48_31415 [Micromonospora sp. NPDC049089]|uniref:hypothetical protein n=1 Tax=unclassified Micromonospora TaxID=2617518 RepID=UPI00340CE796